MTQNKHKHLKRTETFHAHVLYNEHTSQRFASMAEKTKPSLHTLPLELVHRILNYLDNFNIFCTMRNVCARINTIVDSYRRYQVKFFFISTSYLCYIRNIIHSITKNTLSLEWFLLLTSKLWGRTTLEKWHNYTIL